MDGRALRAFDSAEAFCADIKVRLNRSIEADASLHAIPAALSPRDVLVWWKRVYPSRSGELNARENVRRRRSSCKRLA